MNLSPRDRQAVIILLVVAALAGVVFVLTRGGSGGGEAIPVPVAVGTGPTPVPVASPSPSPTPQDGSNLVFSGRDPFQPLVDLTETVPTPTTDTGSPQPTLTVSPASTPPPAPSGGSSMVIGGHTVVLLDVFNQDGIDMAQVEVDGTVYTVSEGETFADDFQLLSVDGTCADFLYGDGSFTLCESTGK